MFGSLGGVMDISFFFTRDAVKDPEIQEMATDCNKFASFLGCLQCKAETEGIQGGLCGQCKQSVAQDAERNLWISTLKYGTC